MPAHTKDILENISFSDQEHTGELFTNSQDEVYFGFQSKSLADKKTILHLNLMLLLKDFDQLNKGQRINIVTTNASDLPAYDNSGELKARATIVIDKRSKKSEKEYTESGIKTSYLYKAIRTNYPSGTKIGELEIIEINESELIARVQISFDQVGEEVLKITRINKNGSIMLRSKVLKFEQLQLETPIIILGTMRINISHEK